MLKRVQKTLAVLGILTALHTPAFAQSTALKRMFQSKDAAEPLKLQDKHGPWLILAQTFPGDEGKDQAVAYAKEIASQFRVATFIWERNNETEEVLGRGERERTTTQGGTQKNLLEVKYANAGPNKSFAVLVGEFQSKEDPQIAKLKEQIKKYEPKAKLPQYARVLMLTRNPLLPDDFFQAPPVDAFIEQLNRQDWIRYSLLDCKGRFTARVASFRGSEIIDVGNKAKTKIEEPTNALDKAASKAHKMTEALRAKGVEAYEYHDRFGSYVTVGSFDSLGSEQNGQFQYDPRIAKILSDLCGYRVVPAKDKITGAETQTMMVKTEEVRTKDGAKGYIPYDIEGKPIAVPKVQNSKLYGGSVFK